jgi:glycine/D-amino acid oxidase-like deaminating enzyme/nitrite reductase/ring-hydroxylating ferredoxin subunit
MAAEIGSVWRAGYDREATPPLPTDLTADLCVVGAGIAGLSIGAEAALAGLKVVVLEADEAGGGETSYTSAHLTNVFDAGFATIERHAGTDTTRLAANAHMAAIGRIEELSRTEGIDCQFQRVHGYLFAHNPKAAAIIADHQAVTERCNEPFWKPVRLARAPLRRGARATLRFPNQGIFHPLSYLRGLIDILERNGGLLFEHTRVTAVHSGEPARVETAEGPVVTARFVAIATNNPINDKVVIHTKQAPYHTYVTSFTLPRSSMKPALFWDTEDPFHYARVSPALDGSGEDLLIVGGEDHKAAHETDAERRWQALEKWTRHFFPKARGPIRKWSGQVMNSIDGLGFIGRNPADTPNVFVSTGDTGMGMTGGVLAGMLIRDLMLDRSNPYVDVFDPSRKPMTSAGTFLKEQADVVVQYADWITPGEKDDIDAITAGTGAIIRRGLKKYAVSRDKDGTVTCLSAACTHLGCVVAWNPAGSTWDCPCHGSRFRPDGTVIVGPAAKPLEAVAVEELEPSEHPAHSR